jgi:hypothetical protein
MGVPSSALEPEFEYLPDTLELVHTGKMRLTPHFLCGLVPRSAMPSQCRDVPRSAVCRDPRCAGMVCLRPAALGHAAQPRYIESAAGQRTRIGGLPDDADEGNFYNGRPTGLHRLVVAKCARIDKYLYRGYSLA